MLLIGQQSLMSLKLITTPVQTNEIKPKHGTTHFHNVFQSAIADLFTGIT